MRPVRIELLRGGCALGPRRVHAERNVVGEAPDDRRGQARGRCGERARSLRRVVPHALDARPERDLPYADVSILEQERARRPRIDGRHERLRPGRRHLALAELRAERALPRSPRRVQDLDPALVGVVRDARADLPAFELDVRVIVDAEPQPDLGEAPEPDPVRANVDPRLLELDSRAVRETRRRVGRAEAVPVDAGMRVEALVVGVPAVAGYAVAAVQAAHGETDRSLPSDPRSA